MSESEGNLATGTEDQKQISFLTELGKRQDSEGVRVRGTGIGFVKSLIDDMAEWAGNDDITALQIEILDVWNDTKYDTLEKTRDALHKVLANVTFNEKKEALIRNVPIDITVGDSEILAEIKGSLLEIMATL